MEVYRLRSAFVVFLVAALSACAPALKRDLMSRAILNPSMRALQQDPDRYKGRLFVLGGQIVKTSVTEDGSFIEAVALPVNERGYISEGQGVSGRFIVRLKQGKGLLDPMIYKEGLLITVAGIFSELREGKIDEGTYLFPLFDLEEIRLWEENAPTFYILEPFPGWMYYPYPVSPYYPWRPYPPHDRPYWYW